MQLTATLLATWIAALALGAVWAGIESSGTDVTFKDDPYIIAG